MSDFSINEIIAGGWVGDETKARALRQALRQISLADYAYCLTSAGLAIKAGASTLAKAGTAFYAIAGGVAVTKVANTDMAALSGTVTNAKFNVFVYYIDSASALTSLMGTEGATLAAVVFPLTPTNKAAIGFTIINPTGAGNFVGGTTALDDGGVVPNALYVNLVAPFNPARVNQILA